MKNTVSVIVYLDILNQYIIPEAMIYRYYWKEQWFANSRNKQNDTWQQRLTDNNSMIQQTLRIVIAYGHFMSVLVTVKHFYPDVERMTSEQILTINKYLKYQWNSLVITWTSMVIIRFKKNNLTNSVDSLFIRQAICLE